MKTYLFLGFLLSLLYLQACKNDELPAKKDKVLAKVNNKTLYLSDLEGMIPERSTPEDSLMMQNAYVERWVRDNLMMDEAERNIPKDLNIDKLVRDYRASLILHSYEKMLTEQMLDSTISQQELQEFYEKNKEQYQLETPIVRCYFLKVARPTPEAENLQKWWNGRDKDSHQKLVNYANRYAKTYMLEDTVWYKVEDIANELPKGTLTQDNISPNREFTLKDDKFQYYFRAFAVKYTKEIAPLSFIKDQASKYILHNRKIQLLENKKEELFERETRKNNVKIYTN